MITQAVCPSCGAPNRVAAGHPSAKAKCGKCGVNLALGAPVEVDDAAFARHLQLTRGAVLLDVWAPWCGPCRTMAPQFEAAASRLSGEVRLLKMNADTTQTPNKLGVNGIPALILFVDGREVGRQAGPIRADALVNWVQAKASALNTTTRSA